MLTLEQIEQARMLDMEGLPRSRIARDNVQPWLHFDDDGSVWRRVIQFPQEETIVCVAPGRGVSWGFGSDP
ncbi:MAG: hypothetical protein LBC97_00315 [Bifidobacteriaceae bacterium]|jgi:hypothetical protein|nr:hypothetical protein [Bifidobacteriaceae bacterium]